VIHKEIPFVVMRRSGWCFRNRDGLMSRLLKHTCRATRLLLASSHNVRTGSQDVRLAGTNTVNHLYSLDV